MEQYRLLSLRPIFLKAGKNEIAILSMTVGLQEPFTNGLELV
jgi:hypothetical protein